MHHPAPRPARPVSPLVGGKVYVLRSAKYPGVHKVGRTAWRTEWRAEQLANEAGYRGFAPFLPVYEVETSDTVAVEAGAHRRLDRFRVVLRCGSRELFRADEARCRRAVDEACADAEAALRLRAVWGRGSPLPAPLAAPLAGDRWAYLILAVLAAILLLWAL